MIVAERLRRGSGILLSGVILTLAILSVSAVSRSFFTTSQAAECQAAMAGELCEELAGSMVAEMEAQVRAQLAKPDSPIMEKLTTAVIGNDPGAYDLTAFLESKEIAPLVGQDAFAEVAPDEATCRCVVQKPLDRLPYERIGVILFHARVTGNGGGRKLARTVDEARAFKIVLVGPPRPFDRYGLFLGELSNVTSLQAVNPARGKLLDELSRLRAKLDAGVAAQSGDPKEKLLDILDELPVKEGAEKSVNEMGDSQNGSMLYGLIPTFAEIDLGKLELARSAADAADAADAMINALPGDSDPQLPVKGAEVAKIVSNALWSIWAFQATFTVLSPANALYGQYKPFLSKLDESWYARRAHYRLTEDPKLPDVNEQLKELRRGGPLFGIIHVMSKTQMLNLSGYYPGRVMFAVGAGGVTVQDINRNETKTDRLTIAAFGGPLKVVGECHAHVMTGAGAPLQLDKQGKIVGGLTVRELVGGSHLGGRVVRMEKYSAGVARPDGSEKNPTVFTLILSPQILYRKVTRS